MKLFYVLVEYVTVWVNIAPAWTFPYVNYGGESYLLLLPETSDIQDIFSTGQPLPVAILFALIIYPHSDHSATSRHFTDFTNFFNTFLHASTKQQGLFYYSRLLEYLLNRISSKPNNHYYYYYY